MFLFILYLATCAMASNVQFSEEEKGFMQEWAVDQKKLAIEERIIILQEMLHNIKESRDVSFQRIRRELPLSTLTKDDVKAFVASKLTLIRAPAWFHDHLMSRRGSFDAVHRSQLVDELIVLNEALPTNARIPEASLAARVDVWARYCVTPLLRLSSGKKPPCHFVDIAGEHYSFRGWTFTISAVRQYLLDLMEIEQIAQFSL